jgi:hypothetical protein
MITPDRYGIFGAFVANKFERPDGSYQQQSDFSSASRDVTLADLPSLAEHTASRWDEVYEFCSEFYDAMQHYAVIDHFYIGRGAQPLSRRGPFYDMNIMNGQHVARQMDREGLARFITEMRGVFDFHELMRNDSVVRLDIPVRVKLMSITLSVNDMTPFHVRQKYQEGVSIKKYLEFPNATVVLNYPVEGTDAVPQAAELIVYYHLPTVADPRVDDLSDMNRLSQTMALVPDGLIPMDLVQFREFILRYAQPFLSTDTKNRTFNGFPLLHIVTVTHE